MDWLANPQFHAKWSITSPVLYVISIVVAALLTRLVLSIFKAFAMQDGEHLPPGYPAEKDQYKDYRYCQLFKVTFCGMRGEPNASDYWLGALIGIAELVAFPVLFQLGQLAVIGSWLALKTAGQWRVWANSRSAFNRFLLGNIINVLVSCLWLSQFVAVHLAVKTSACG